MATGTTTAAQGASTVSHFTTLSPVLRDRRRSLSRRLFVVRYLPGAGRPLTHLSFIHYASWTVFDSLPAAAGRGRRPLKWRYLLFESNYDGLESDYLDTFADVIPLRIAALFGACFRFTEEVEHAPAITGRVIPPGPFRRFVDLNKLDVLDYYEALPGATVTGVRQALAMRERMRRNGGMDAQALAVALGEPQAGRRIAEDWLVPLTRALTGRYGVNPVFMIAPIRVGHEEQLRALCATEHPLRHVPAAHFARLALIPPQLKDLGQPRPDRLECSYLVFSSNHHGTLGDHVEGIRTGMPDEADAIWSHCEGYPGTSDRAAFHDFFARGRLGTRYYFSGYAPRSVDELRTDLTEANRSRLASLPQRRPEASSMAGAR